jgi:DNA-binding ferritin-like protein
MIEQALLEAFGSNLVAYYRSHAAHANTTGRNFYSDHKLLQKIYEELQEQIDTLGEFLRSIGVKMPPSLGIAIGLSRVYDEPIVGDYLANVEEDLETLVEVYKDLYDACDDTNIDISNYAQDRTRELNRFIWMITATVGDEND